MNHIVFAFCQQCEKTRDLDKHGRCSCCNSDAVLVRSPHRFPSPSVIEELIELEKMFRRD